MPACWSFSPNMVQGASSAASNNDYINYCILHPPCFRLFELLVYAADTLRKR